MLGFSLTQHRITILLVDDQPIVGETVRQMLATEQDIDFHYCHEPTQAIKIANRIHPTVILQDLVMPDIDGLALVRYFRANKATRDVPLIVLSSKEEPHIKAEAFALGANDYLVKLPDKLEVIARIRYHSSGYINLLQRNEAHDALVKAQKQLEECNRFIRKTFGRYLSDDIVNALLESPEGLKLGGEKRRVTIMMSDLRGFTSISERLPAESVVGVINTYLEAMTDIILKHEGTIDEFIGDAVMVIFGAPIRREDDARRAVACALEMQLAMNAVNSRLAEMGYPEVAMGIGINTGEVVVGNIGSKKRTKYGIVGRNVNLTSRIESYTVGGQIYVSEDTAKDCGPVLRIDGQMQVMPKGVKEPITIYEIGGVGGGFDIHLPVKENVELLELEQPLPISFNILSGKHSGKDKHPGGIVKMADKIAEVCADVIPDQLRNLKVYLLDEQGDEVDGDLYAKVAGPLSESPSAFRMVFTSISPEAEAFLHNNIRLRRIL